MHTPEEVPVSRQVTAGVDGTPESLSAAHWAAEEARRRGLPLLLVHVEEWPLPLAVAVPTVNRDDHRRWADGLLADAAAEVRGAHAGVALATRRLSGRAPAALAAAAARAELLVLGSRGLGTVTGALLGSVGQAVIGASERPVVVVRTGGDDRARDVVVGVELHHGGGPQHVDAAVLDFAFEAARLRGGLLRAVHVARPPVLHGRSPEHRAAAERHGLSSLALALGPWRLRHPEVTVEQRVAVGPPARILVAEADGAALVVVGRRVRHAPVVPHIGPVAHAAIHHCTVPVAVVAHGPAGG